MQLNSLGIVGYGQFGQFVHQLARHNTPHLPVYTYDREKETSHTLQEVATCDLVVVAVPIRAYEELIASLVPHLGPETILVDICTVKKHPLTILQQYPGLKYLCTHPMFGPYSYEKKGSSLEGLKIVLAEHSFPDTQYQYIKEVLTSAQLTIVEMSADEHDKHLAETLFLTHYMTQVIDHAGFCRSEIDTVSFGFLMDAVESVKHDTELFKDVYHFNPYCKETIRKLQEAGITVHKMLDTL